MLNFVQVRIEYTCDQLCVYIQGNPFEIRTPTLEPDWPQHDSHAACVFAEHYFSTTTISLHFYSCKDQLSACLKNLIISIFLNIFWSSASL